MSYDTINDATDIADLFEEVPDKGLDEEDEVNISSFHKYHRLQS